MHNSVSWENIYKNMCRCCGGSMPPHRHHCFRPKAYIYSRTALRRHLTQGANLIPLLVIARRKGPSLLLPPVMVAGWQHPEQAKCSTQRRRKQWAGVNGHVPVSHPWRDEWFLHKYNHSNIRQYDSSYTIIYSEYLSRVTHRQCAQPPPPTPRRSFSLEA